MKKENHCTWRWRSGLGVGPIVVLFVLVWQTDLRAEPTSPQDEQDDETSNVDAPDADLEEETPTEETPTEEADFAEDYGDEQPPEMEEDPPAEDKTLDETSETDDLEDTEKEEVHVIIGSHIGRRNEESPGHITVLNSEDILLSGVTNIEQILTMVPSVSLGGIKATHPEGDGFAGVDLRNLGPGRTLTLLNGRRVIGSGGPAVDLNVIPVAMVDRVEILLDGASAVYGSDAVAGVINIVLKEDFDGFNTTANSGISTHGDGEQLGLSTTLGSTGDNGNVTMNFSWNHRSPVYQKDRAWANPPCEQVNWAGDGESTMSLCGSPTTPGGVFTFPAANPAIYGDYPEGFIFTGSDGDFHGMQQYYETWQQEYADGIVDTPYDAYNWGEQMPMSGQSDRFQLVTNGHYELGEFVTAYMEGLYVYHRHGGRYAGEPVTSGHDLYPDALSLHLSNPFIPQQFWDGIINEYGINYAAPTMGFVKRTNDLGARVFDTTTSTFRAVAGFKGEISPDYKWDIFFNYGRYVEIDVTRNSPDMERLHRVLDPEVCYASPGCVLANMFGEGTMQGDVREYVGFDGTNTFQWDMINTGAEFVMHPFKLPGGKFGAVIGGDLRWERGMDSPDSKTQDGVSGTNTSSASTGGYNAQEAFVELSAPFLKDIPGVDILTLDLAGRMSHFNVFGTEFTYRAALIYGPIEDIKIRGVASSSYKAPSISNLYGGYFTSYPTVSDPCSNWQESDDEFTQQQCEQLGVPDDYVQGATQVRTNNGSNPDLHAETSRTLNVGTVVTPTFMPVNMPLSATFDWYNIWIYEAIAGLSASDILENCYTVPGLQEYCDFVERQESGDISVIDQSLINVGEIRTSGFDFTVNLGFPIFKDVTGQFNFQGNILRELVEEDPDAIAAGADPADAVVDYTGLIEPLGSGTPKFRFISSVSFGTHKWQLSNRVRYIHSMDIRNVEHTQPYYDVPSVMYWDMSGSFRHKNFDIVVGVDNVLDKEPPYFPGTGYNALPQVYDMIGRYVWTKIGYTFN